MFRSIASGTAVLASTLLILLSSCAPAPKAAAPVVAVPPADAVETYRTWVLGQADQFLTKTEAFAAAVTAGRRAEAQALYGPARQPYERIEPIAEALGDLDPRIDAREGDVPDGEWGGFHKIEKVLWSTDDLKTAAPVAATLVADVRLLRARIESASITVPTMVAGAVELLNEVSSSKVTGEEERYSHTDLWDFDANLGGAEQIWLILAPGARPADPELGKILDARFSALHGLLEVHRQGEGFQPYTEVDPEQVKALSAAVDALAEPLAQLGQLFPSE